ncbi:MAG: 16S rRNA (cytosine(1402)-N(4))-methyltransferase RsmH [Selenomonadaceae bacterium]|nr:16S rRNA (cytosine(1402)-N(4))-methyltransferase RsmH [Selenomonadaceae bacterium]
MKFEHKSVMPDEVLKILQPRSNGIYLDCTLGGGGHSLKIGEFLSEEGFLIGIDQDLEAIRAAEKKLSALKCKVEIAHGNFSHLEKILDNLNVDKIDGVIFDLGVSSHQIDTAERGFSYIHDAPLDMRMDRTQKFSAADVINNYDETRLVKIFSEYGEERFSKRIAAAIIKSRPIETTGELVKIIENSAPHIKNGGHPAKRIFQAVRIEVNHELEILSNAITQAVKKLKVGGKIAVITFHSLEDRIVKNTFKNLAQGCTCPKNFPVCVCGHKAEIKILGKAQTATGDELKENSRAKSAKLRAAEKIFNA